MWIRVSQTDINRGVRGDAALCPLARALNRAFGYRYSVEVGSMGVSFFTLAGRRGEVRLPAPAQDFIAWFDNTNMHDQNAYRPFRFQIVRPQIERGW